MRDPNRIPEFLAKVEKLWRVYPDMRFGQFVIYLHHMASEGKKIPDLFSIEDTPMSDTIEILMARINNGKDSL